MNKWGFYLSYYAMVAAGALCLVSTIALTIRGDLVGATLSAVVFLLILSEGVSVAITFAIRALNAALTALIGEG